MSDTCLTIHNRQVLICASDGNLLTSERDALDLIGEAMQQGIELVLIPMERLDENFFHLKTGLAGQIIQKFVVNDLRHESGSLLVMDSGFKQGQKPRDRKTDG